MHRISPPSKHLPPPPELARQPERRTARHMAPFFGASLLAWIAVPIGSPMHWGIYAASAATATLAGILAIAPLGGILAKARETIPSLVFLLAIALLRDSAGGVNSAVGTLAMLPVFYTALYSSRTQLCTVLVGMTAVLFAQNLLIGPPAYPHSQYRAGVTFIVVSTIIGLVTQRLVSQRAEMLDYVSEMLSQVSDIASTDALTGLPNRRAWDVHLAEMFAEDRHLTVTMLDLDHFKEFNDSQGHPAGDRLLRETAAAWREELRAGDFVARLGGDEFALLLPDCAAANALEVVERLRRRIPNQQACSAGIAAHVPGAPPEALMSQADAALYEAKTAGRDRTCMTA
ncbi:MAG: diguanylate cyclase domain-containing protein [Solirubrobacteraceae bacterium]